MGAKTHFLALYNMCTTPNYNKIVHECKIAITKFDADREEKILKSNNLGTFYRFVNKMLSDRSGIAPLINNRGILITSDSHREQICSIHTSSRF